jgi:hypothetical protein
VRWERSGKEKIGRGLIEIFLMATQLREPKTKGYNSAK